MNTEKLDKLMDTVEPVIKMVAQSDIQIKILTKHYVKTMSELTHKTENEILEELKEIQEDVKEKEIEKIEKNQ